MGRIVAWDELWLFEIWDELSLGPNRSLGRIVALCCRLNTNETNWIDVVTTSTRVVLSRTYSH